MVPQSSSSRISLSKKNLYQGIHDILGDGRASEQPGLTAIHTIFLREHNRLVEGLRGVNPHWDADLLFEHARRILAATFSQIIYNEFLPRLLSWNAVNLYGLKLLPAGNLFFVTVLCRQNVFYLRGQSKYFDFDKSKCCTILNTIVYRQKRIRCDLIRLAL